MQATVFTVRELLQDLQLPRGVPYNNTFEIGLLWALLPLEWTRGDWSLDSKIFGPDAVIVINPFMHYNQYFLEPALASIRNRGFVGPVVFLSPNQDIKVVPDMELAWSYLLPDDCNVEGCVEKILNVDILPSFQAKSTT